MATRGPDHGGSRLPIPYRALAGFIVACAAFAAIFVALAVGAYHAPRPHNLPVGIVGSATVTGGVEHALDGALPGAISWRSYPSAADAQTGIMQREVDGALVASGPAPAGARRHRRGHRSGQFPDPGLRDRGGQDRAPPGGDRRGAAVAG